MPSKPVCLYEVIFVSGRDFDTMDDALRPMIQMFGVFRSNVMISVDEMCYPMPNDDDAR